MLCPTNNFGLDILQSIHFHEKKPLDGPPRGVNGGPIRPPGDNSLKTPSTNYTLLHHDTHNQLLGK